MRDFLWYDRIMIKLLLLVGMFFLGAALGSFACCQAWRLKYAIDGKKSLGKRSVCLHCKYQLKWYDNIPVFSWLFLRGRCRKCKKKIGYAEILAELGMGAAFAMLAHAYLLPMIFYWDMMLAHPLQSFLQLAALALTFIMLVVLGILAVYDAKWGELPVVLLWVVNVLGALILVFKTCYTIVLGGDWLGGLISAGVGVMIMAGTCWAIYRISNEKLMGGGDWILALAIALALGNWWLALWAMFLANLLGDIIMLPSLIQKGNHVLHFGPFLAIGFVIVLWLSNALPVLNLL